MNVSISAEKCYGDETMRRRQETKPINRAGIWMIKNKANFKRYRGFMFMTQKIATALRASQ